MMNKIREWYYQQAEDYISILQNQHEYTLEELHEASRRQRVAEYTLYAHVHGSRTKRVKQAEMPLIRYTTEHMKLGWGDQRVKERATSKQRR